ncbi:hypothetical protein [Muricomes intestini]|uniref:hypothetical protein n=1 Tax=Muricomes intestini TaxID=1796634 RepID=UPI002FE0F876|nr:hypothetical protein [Lachnospiraceae bacterium]
MRDKSRINTVLLTMILAVLCFCAVILAYKAQPGQNKLSAKDTSSPYDDAQYCYEQVRERTDFVPEIALCFLHYFDTMHHFLPSASFR